MDITEPHNEDQLLEWCEIFWVRSYFYWKSFHLGCFGWGGSRVVSSGLIEAQQGKSCHPGGLLPLSNLVMEVAHENDMSHKLLPSYHRTMPRATSSVGNTYIISSADVILSRYMSISFSI